MAPTPPHSDAIPIRLLTLGLLVVGVVFALTGLVRNEPVILALGVIDLVPTISVAVIAALVGRSRSTRPPTVDPPPESAGTEASLLVRTWLWLTTCAADGCNEHPTHLGWCERHAPTYHREPDEHWDDDEKNPQ